MARNYYLRVELWVRMILAKISGVRVISSTSISILAKLGSSKYMV